MFHLFGGADEDFDLADWSNGAQQIAIGGGAASEAAQVSGVEAVARMWSFSGELVRAAIENPGDDYMGDLIRSRRADPSLFTDNYLRNVVFVMLAAGMEMPSYALPLCIWTMLDDRAPWQRLCADPDLIPNAVEEIMRFGTAVRGFPRLATRDGEVGGQRIPAGANIWLMLASGNRDETVFPDGDVLDLERENAGEHLSMGYGAHRCIGGAVARLHMKVVLEELTRRLPDMRRADVGVSHVFRTLMFGEPKRLPVEWS